MGNANLSSVSRQSLVTEETKETNLVLVSRQATATFQSADPRLSLVSRSCLVKFEGSDPKLSLVTRSVIARFYHPGVPLLNVFPVSLDTLRVSIGINPSYSDYLILQRANYVDGVAGTFEDIQNPVTPLSNYDDSGLDSNSRYFYRLIAKNYAYKTYSSEVLGSLSTSPPQNFKLQKLENGTIKLTCDPYSPIPIDGYRWKRSTDKVSWTNLADTTSPLYEDATVEYPDGYAYEVCFLVYGGEETNPSNILTYIPKPDLRGFSVLINNVPGITLTGN